MCANELVHIGLFCKPLCDKNRSREPLDACAFKCLLNHLEVRTSIVVEIVCVYEREREHAHIHVPLCVCKDNKRLLLNY